MRTKLNIFLILILLPFIIFAKSNKAPSAILEYYDNEDQIAVYDSNGNPREDLEFGMSLNTGDMIETTATTAEIRLDPNSSIIKIAANTKFEIKTIQGKNNETVNQFSLIKGKIRAIAANTGLANYSVTTPSAVCGVRGTDFALEVIQDVSESAAVNDGLVEFLDTVNNKTVALGPGTFADLFSETFEAMPLPPDKLKSFFKDMDFKKLKAEKVKGKDKEGKNDKSEKENEKEKSGGSSNESLLGFLGFEIGTITIDGVTYQKAVVQPIFTFGKLTTQLYIPVIYNTNLMDPNDWYQPRGNNEWSFGTDKEGTGEILSDFFSDLALKIKYAEYGKQRDKFFFKIGNLDNITLGHGTLMRNFANDLDFPAIRRVGLNIGSYGESGGIEAMFNDLVEPEIMGVRVFYGKPLALGITGIIDINPEADLPEAVASTIDDPYMIGAGLDLEIAPLDGDKLSLIIFADSGVLFPYYQDGYTFDSVENDSGKVIQRALENNGNYLVPISNFSAATGIMGKLIILDYRLELQYFNGVIRNNIFGTNYERLRGQYLTEMNLYLDNPDAYAESETMGIYGEGGFKLGKILTFELGYLWPWEITDDGIDRSYDDKLHLGLIIHDKAIPFFNVHGAIYYDRIRFYETISNSGDNDLDLFDENTVFSGEIVYPFTESLDLAIVFSTTFVRDEDGDVVYDDDGSPEMTSAISLETRIAF